MSLKAVAVSCLALSLASSASAWEKAKNPDRFPSIGLTYTGIAEDGEYKTLGFTQDTELLSRSLVLDTRLPLSDSFTLNLGLGTTASEIEGEESAAFNADEFESSGALFTVGGRFYFNR